MSAHFTTPTDELLLLAETLGEVKTKADKLEAEFSTQARPLEAATNALSAALSGIKALQFHVLDNNLGQLSARVEEMRKAVDEQVGVIALELKKADETNAEKAGQEAEALRSEIAALQAQLGTLGAQFSAQLERVEFSAKEEAKKLQLIPGPAGAAGASLNPRGTFVDGETYNRLDVVTWLGSSYIAAVDGVTEKPSKNSNQWQVLASRGSGGSGGAGDFGSLAGVAQINQGGTGQTTRAAGLNALLPSQTGAVQYMLLTDGAGTVSWGAQPVAGLPSQTSNGGKLLTTDGTNASWSAVLAANADTSLQVGALAPYQRATIGLTRRLNYGDALFARNLQGKASSDNYTTVGTDSGSGYAGFEAQYGGVARILLGTGATTAGADVTPTVALSASTSAVSIPLTTASTTTSTGALVVGNGTSGGLGVGGSIVAGGNITLSGTVGIGIAASGDIGLQVKSTLSTGSNQYGLYSYPTFNAATVDGGFFGVAAAASSSVGSAFSLRAYTPTLNAGAAISTIFGLKVENHGAAGVTNAYGIDISAQSGASSTNVGLRNAGTTLLTNSTASTSTSSGALVVGGGVGVAGKVTATSVGVANTSQSIAAWGDIGPQLSVAGAVITDTSSSGTVSRAVANSIAASALAASSTTTYTAAASLFIAGAPTANTNVTITNAYALYTAAGRINFQGLPTSAAGLQAGTLWNDSGTLKVA